MDIAALENEKKLLRRLTISAHGIAKCTEILTELTEITNIGHVYEAALSFVLLVYARPFSCNEKSGSAKALSKLSKEMVTEELDEKELRLHNLIIRLRNKAIAHVEWKMHPTDIDEEYVISTRQFSVFSALQGHSVEDVRELVKKVHSIIEMRRAATIGMLQLMRQSE